MARVATSSSDVNSGQTSAARGIAYKHLKRTHPEYDAEYWRILRALYEGGRRLLRDAVVMGKIFPPHRDERPNIYRQRRSLAFFIPYPAEILGHIVAGLASDPIEMELGGDDGEEKKPLPPYYQGFYEDVTAAGAGAMSLNKLLTEQIRTGLQTGAAWTLVELPPAVDGDGEPVEYDSPAEQEERGALNAYAVKIEPECVVDWEFDDTGELDWALLHFVHRPRPTLEDSRGMVRERWKFYTRYSWTEYEVVHPEDAELKDDDIVPVRGEGDHSFRRVPLAHMRLPDGLWAMDKIESLAREHFNKRSALGWGERQSLIPDLYEFLGPEDAAKGAVIGGTQEDPDRAVNQQRGPGYVQRRGAGDRAEFVGPEVGAFAEARTSCDSLRDDMHRVLHQMALSTPNTASALKRSAESKEMDTAAVGIILMALGELAREHARSIYNLVSRGRGDGDKEYVGEWVAGGMATFDVVAVATAIADALSIDALNIESPTFRREHRKGLVRIILGDTATPEVIEKIDGELDENITDESIAPGAGELAAMDKEAKMAAAKARSAAPPEGVPARTSRPGKKPAKPKA